jgi:hypothetical protein
MRDGSTHGAMRRWGSHIGCAGAVGLLVLAGCRPANPRPAVRAPAKLPEAPKGEALADPMMREARDQAEAILGDLLAGKFENDPDLVPLSKKLKGYQAWTIRSQEALRADAAAFHGELAAPGARARFTMTLVKQENGKWAVGAFSGPNPQ